MSVTLQMNGLTELYRDLRRLPTDLADEAGTIVIAHAELAERQIETGYPEGPTGNLRRGVTTEKNRSKFGSSAIVRSRAKHAFIFEKGTVGRRTSKGYNRGRMPEANVAQQMIPKVIRARRRMVEALKDLVRRAGFEVSE